MHVVVTGAAGFVGSHLVEALVSQGHTVAAADCLLSASYDPLVKLRNWQRLGLLPEVELFQLDLRVDPIEPLLHGADCVINEAAMPGLVKSWSDFAVYASCNLLAVERLLAASTKLGVGRFIQISTSSVYGRNAVGGETQTTRPYSPYGVTKLAAENLVKAYSDNFGLPSQILRYFSVYGPRQRPDMGYHIFCEALLDGRPISVFGSGLQTRSNTFVSDVVTATIAAAAGGEPGQTYNICGSETISLLDAVEVLADELGVSPVIEHLPARPGDQYETAGDSSRALSQFGWMPTVGIEEGLRLQARWHRGLRSGGSNS